MRKLNARTLSAAGLATLGLLVAAPLLAMPAFAQTAPSTAPTGAPTSTPTRPAKAPAPSAAPSGAGEHTLLDINSASREELDALPGIGAARSEAIIKGRPYHGKDDLVRKKIIPSNVYNTIKDRIIARQKP